MTGADRIVVIGVAGSGKSTIGAGLAARTGVRFLEGDDFHPASNIKKMASGFPLTDDDRWSWLAALRRAMREEQQVVVSCSALTRACRDALRAAENVRFVDLVVERDEIVRRVTARTGHVLGASLLDSQFATREPPAPDEVDVLPIVATGEVSAVLDRVEAALSTFSPESRSPLHSFGGPGSTISVDELRIFIDDIAATEVVAPGARRVLLVAPDHTRADSGGGRIAGLLFETLTAAGCSVAVLPALGTHAAMTSAASNRFFEERIPVSSVLEHRWREAVTRLGEISAAEVSALSGGRLCEPIWIDVNEHLLGEWDLVVSIGQVVPHEVIGMANFTKNLVIGLGGEALVNETHLLGALCGMETIMGRTQSPVRDVVDAAFDRFIARRVPVLWILTVMQDTPGGVLHRGLFVGRGGSGDTGGAAYRKAAELSSRCNIEEVAAPLPRVVCFLDPAEFTTTWLGNKAIYRTRMALADGGELIVLAPGVSRFADDPLIDTLIRRHGYRGTPHVVDALEHDTELAENRGAAAHLIHGSSEGRFRVVYCTDPAAGGLRREEVEGVGYTWRSLPAELDELGVSETTVTGQHTDCSGIPFTFNARPALGLWTTTGKRDQRSR
jgi:carbohydrate kinase (thermoresistant glucokinase family)